MHAIIKLYSKIFKQKDTQTHKLRNGFIIIFVCVVVIHNDNIIGISIYHSNTLHISA